MQQYLVVGIITGCLYALTATGLVVTYTTSGIFNFAHGAMGMFMAFVYWQLAVGWHIPWGIALPITLFSLMYWFNRTDRGHPMAHQLAAFYVGKGACPEEQ